MALNIKDEATDRLARELAAATGETITDAVRVAMAERLSRLRRLRATAQRLPDLQQYIERGRRRPLLDPRTPEEILGYDAHGLPT